MFPFNNWPFSNFHQLNADWILQVIKDMADKVEKVKDAYSPQQPPPYPVTSVNGKTGDVKTPFTGTGTEPLKMFDTSSSANYYGFNRKLSDGKTLECWIKEDGHISLVLRSASGSELHNWQLMNNDEIPTSGVITVNGKYGIVTLNAADVGAVPYDNVVDTSEANDHDFIPSSIVTHALQDQVNTANGHFANSNAQPISFFGYSVQNTSTLTIPIKMPTGNSATLAIMAGSRFTTIRISTSGGVTVGPGLSDTSAHIGASYADGSLTLTGLPTYTRVIVVSTYNYTP